MSAASRTSLWSPSIRLANRFRRRSLREKALAGEERRELVLEVYRCWFAELSDPVVLEVVVMDGDRGVEEGQALWHVRFLERGQVQVVHEMVEDAEVVERAGFDRACSYERFER